MPELLATALFYVFSTVLLLAAVAVVSARNPVHSVLFLILAFFNAGALFLMIGAEYLAMTLIIVYVGAVAVLFLFVVMMLNINLEEIREGFLRYLPVGAAVAGVMLAEIVLAMMVSLRRPETLRDAAQEAPSAAVSNTEAIGSVLYTTYLYPFQIAGLVLLVAMIGAIVLTHRSRPGVRRQNISQQVNRRREDAVALVNVKPGQGA